MKKWIVIALIAPLCWLSFACVPKQEKRAKTPKTAAAEVPPLAPVILIEENGRTFSSGTLPGKTILIFFGASCDHCQREATQIHHNLKGFEGYTLYFISMDPFPVIHKFAKEYGMADQANIHFVRAEGTSVYQSLGYMQTPTILIYNGDQKLIKRFDGETKVEEILKLL